MFVPLLGSLTDVFLPVLYVVTATAYGLAFFREEAFAKLWKSRLLLATTVTHFFAIGLHTAQHGHCMVTTIFEMMSLVAFTVITTYTVIEFRTNIKGTGFFLVCLASLFELVSAVGTKLPVSQTPNPVLSNMGIGLHVSSAVFGFGGIAISAVYGMLYLFLHRALKKGDFGSFFKHLPSLESLERLSAVAMVLGFMLLTVAILIGGFWLPRTFENFSYADPKLVATGAVWLLYSIVLVAKYALRLDGKRVITLSLAGFVLSMLSFTVVNAFFSGFHRFF